MSLRCFARSMRYGKSKPDMLYPIIISGSTLWRNLDHSNNSFDSSLKGITCEPAILEQVLSVKIFRMKGLDSPVHDMSEFLVTVISYALEITLPSHHVGDLDDRVLVSLREDTLPARALDIKAKDSKRCNLGPFAFGWMRDEFVPSMLP